MFRLPSKARKPNSEQVLILAGLPCLRKTVCYAFVAGIL
jgi:hypothetical protein